MFEKGEYFFMMWDTSLKLNIHKKNIVINAPYQHIFTIKLLLNWGHVYGRDTQVIS